MINVANAFEALPDTVIYGTGMQGQGGHVYSLVYMSSNQKFEVKGAHNMPITCIEYTSFQNEETIFTGS